MTDSIMVQYVGFEVKNLVREYTFQVRGVGEEPREFTLTILNEAFDSHRARYQDAPDICSRRLAAELTASANRPLKTHFRVTDAEIELYHGTHAPKSRPSPYSRKPIPSA